MAKSNFRKTKARNIDGSLLDLKKRLDNALETDLKRVFQESSYCDLELVFDNESLFSHSCIVKARAVRFYTFITTEYLVSREAIITRIVIEQASIKYLRKFLENVYSSSFLPEAETYVLKYLENLKNHLLFGSKNKLIHSSDPNLLSPESEQFFTPKSSPSEETNKPFTLLTTSEEEISLSKSRNNASVRSYYRIVSLDDFHGEDNERRSDSFEKELAEQDALFESLTLISSKEKVIRPLIKPRARATEKEYRASFNNSTVTSTKVAEKERSANSKRVKRATPILPRLVIPKNKYLIMDLSTTNPEFTLGRSSTPLKIVEADIRGGSLESSVVDISIGGSQCPFVNCKNANLSDTHPTGFETTTKREVNCLKDEDVARLDAMELVIKDCETFLEMERRTSALHGNETRNDQKEILPTESITSGSSLHLEIGKNKLEYSDECSINPSDKMTFSTDILGGLNVVTDLEITEASTPPCSPKVYKEGSTLSNRNINNGNCYSSKNCFIDASSLLDEDEIVSPPLSYMSDMTAREKLKSEACGNCDMASSDPESERRQGDMIFRSSIPHFSKHEIDFPVSNLSPGASHEESVEQIVKESSNSESLQFEPDFTSLLLVSSSAIRDSKDEDNTDFELSHSFPNSFSDTQQASGGTPRRKISAENMPIVSGGVSPRDFATSSSHSSSPHLRRRHEQAPIISGDIETLKENKPLTRQLPSGDVWIVDLSESNNKKLISQGASCDSESKESVKIQKTEMFCDEAYRGDCSADEDFLEKSTSSFPMEKCASLGYFIDFGKKVDPIETAMQESKEIGCGKTKKNMFSMFIDLNDKPTVGSKNEKRMPPAKEKFLDRVPMEPNEMKALDDIDSEKKPFFMFIESESPVVKRKMPQGISRTTQKRNVADGEKEMGGSHNASNSGAGSTVGNFGVDSANFSSLESEGIFLSLQDERDSSNFVNSGVLSTNEPQESLPISSGFHLAEHNNETDEKVLKKGSTFIIDAVPDVKMLPGDFSSLQTVAETTPPKSPKPYEIDSGVIATEESDDSFVRLSDMDNAGKNPYMDTTRRRQNTRMSQSIPEGAWIGKKPSKIPERDKRMSKSIGCGAGSKLQGAVMSSSSTKSISRLFPNLSSSTLSLFRQNGSISGGRLDTENSEFSEFSSMNSSIDPYGLEISTSETDVSYHENGVSRLGQDLLRMFLDEISPDVVVEVGGRRIKAHKCILSSRCQFFAATLSGGWVESAGNVISLQGFSYSAVHFALCHIYSGESEIPDSLNMIELTTLADILGLEGLKEAISYTLRVKYCHSFHSPCASCVIGVLDCLPVAATYGLEELYRKCLRWITKFFVRVWPTKTFTCLPKELLDKCIQYHIVHMTVENVLDTVMSIEKLRGSLPSIRWAETVGRLANKLQDAATKFLADHFSYILTSDQFLSLGKGSEWGVERIEKAMIVATGKLPVEQACWSHGRLHSILSIAMSPDPPHEMRWNQNFIAMLSNLSGHVQSSLIRQAPKASRSKAWQQMEPELRIRIQEAACLVIPNESPGLNSTRRIPPKKEQVSSSFASPSIRNNTRASDLRQFKLAMVQQANRSVAANRRQQLISSDHRWSADVPKSTNLPARRIEVRKSQSTSAVRDTSKSQKAVPAKFTEVKSRYLEPRSPIKVAPEKVAPTTSRKNPRGVSSSDSSRNCSPAMARAANKKCPQPPAKAKATEVNRRVSSVSTRSDTPSGRALSRLTADDNMSTDSLATESSFGEKESLLAKRQLAKGKENNIAKTKDTGPSLPRKTQSFSSFQNVARPQGKKTMIPRIDPDAKSLQGRRLAPAKKSSNASPRTTNQPRPKTTDHAVNGNIVHKRMTVDSENNKTITTQSVKAPAPVSRSGTFLKDEPTVLKKPPIDV